MKKLFAITALMGLVLCGGKAFAQLGTAMEEKAKAVKPAATEAVTVEKATAEKPAATEVEKAKTAVEEKATEVTPAVPAETGKTVETPAPVEKEEGDLPKVPEIPTE